MNKKSTKAFHGLDNSAGSMVLRRLICGVFQMLVLFVKFSIGNRHLHLAPNPLYKSCYSFDKKNTPVNIHCYHPACVDFRIPPMEIYPGSLQYTRSNTSNHYRIGFA